LSDDIITVTSKYYYQNIPLSFQFLNKPEPCSTKALVKLKEEYEK